MADRRKMRKYLMLFAAAFVTAFFISYSMSIKTRQTLLMYRKSVASNTSYAGDVTVSYPLNFVYPYKYNFILNEPDKCKTNDPFLLILIPTRANEIELRSAIRQTWGNESLVPGVKIVRLFLVGIPTQITDPYQSVLQEESSLNHDIIQQDFRDSYINLTIKTMMGLQWMVTFCPKASYAIKIDGDMFLNTEYLVKFLDPGRPMRENYFTGYVVAGTRPIRSKLYKYYVPFELYEPDYYPPYCGGPGYAFSGDMAKKIYDIAHIIKPFNMEDAFIGVCLERLGIQITKTPTSLFHGHKIDYNKCRFYTLITVHHFSAKDLLQIWPDFVTAKDTCPPNKSY
ncbi:beta-1,3-galactosyltransferase 2-like [Protopterus annectens]|uniref:beta-1,3-galactosyltransferase 2-like n=1 Tax=Protopterus annectens TaxID=7888 RepID=UPI001CFA7CBE|nr:beta-1,3-galactosyltransferase 2-like [Protopterus annectens]XP_043940721.1 beta-1,3-galactosyltransferase 2-like [Protopterus annectens]XP_043940722.1 beta-1,3-galactosyltransferase 2-like [Protopterus annectens]XP_043940723.1 beta-1,3-galactosyltransferase 2-like [Protopterus annectens]XP_043940724.1 beta-1,3-galactosyltransferase 2-like [Protopterus annectens]XP_043940726.1 beta-1,3-galactosyltransferase 2-like [Protopterus annectens]XP_043940727.1 beta-1,3-galactosyltransferase 2-like 